MLTQSAAVRCCPVCEAPIPDAGPRQVYCSRACSAVVYRQRRAEAGRPVRAKAPTTGIETGRAPVVGSRSYYRANCRCGWSGGWRVLRDTAESDAQAQRTGCRPA